MKAKRWTKLFLTIILMPIYLYAVILFVFDPAMVYHKPWIGKTAYDFDFYCSAHALSINLAKRYDYESIIAGSSMTANFLISDLEKIMSRPIKFSFGGAIGKKDINLIVNHALKHNKNVKTILIGFDTYASRGFLEAPYDFPLYLLDDNPLNDFSYFTNKRTIQCIQYTIDKLYFDKQEIVFDYEHMFEFFWRPEVQARFGRGNERLEEAQLSSQKAKNFNKLAIKDFQDNFISLVKDNPNIKFIMFFPPYSVLDFVNNDLDNLTAGKKYYASELANYLNVELYDFQDDENITTNLDLYMDKNHYHQKINTYIAERIAARDPRYLVDPATYDERLAHFKKYVSEYRTKFDEE